MGKHEWFLQPSNHPNLLLRDQLIDGSVQPWAPILFKWNGKIFSYVYKKILT